MLVFEVRSFNRFGDIIDRSAAHRHTQTHMERKQYHFFGHLAEIIMYCILKEVSKQANPSHSVTFEFTTQRWIDQRQTKAPFIATQLNSTQLNWTS